MLQWFVDRISELVFKQKWPRYSLWIPKELNATICIPLHWHKVLNHRVHIFTYSHRRVHETIGGTYRISQCNLMVDRSFLDAWPHNLVSHFGKMLNPTFSNSPFSLKLVIFNFLRTNSNQLLDTLNKHFIKFLSFIKISIDVLATLITKMLFFQNA